MADQEYIASWDLFYLTKEGMEAHLQLKGATVTEVLSDAAAAMTEVQEAGGIARPPRRRNGSAEPAPQTDGPECPECKKEMTYREGTSKSGRDYKGYFCPDRDCIGEPIWVND